MKPQGATTAIVLGRRTSLTLLVQTSRFQIPLQIVSSPPPPVLSVSISIDFQVVIVIPHHINKQSLKMLPMRSKMLPFTRPRIRSWLPMCHLAALFLHSIQATCPATVPY